MNGAGGNHFGGMQHLGGGLVELVNQRSAGVILFY